MPGPDGIVARVLRFEPPLDRPAAEVLRAEGALTVVLEGDRRIRLDPADRRAAGFAQILGELAERQRPVYVEVDPDTTGILRLLIPRVTRVVGMEPIAQGSYDVQLEMSHGRHVLRRDSPGFEKLESRLRDAIRSTDPLILTETDAHEIIDVRAYRPDPDDGPLPPFELPRKNWLRELLEALWKWRWWPWWWFRCISLTGAQQAFGAMNATSCDPLAVPPPCIPFLYPDDGCWGRAHEMCRLMINMGLKPRKVWIKGNLKVDTKNNPNCAVWWGWHVAPTLCVRGPGWFKKREMVIDPALFTEPVTQATWKGVQGDPNATLTGTAASIFYLWSSNPYDPNYTQTNQVLQDHRLYLLNRSLQQGPPPYAHCP
jgi:hypothetical protein